MEIRVWERRDELATPVRSSSQAHHTIRRLFVELDDGEVVGFGEVDPVPESVNGDPGFDEVVAALVGPALVRYVDVAEREGFPPEWSRVHRLSGDHRAHRFAFAALEMATLDRELRLANTNLRTRWGVDVAATPRCVTASAVEPMFSWVPPEGSKRVRLKVNGPPAPAVVAWVRSFNLEVLLDFNCHAGGAAVVVDTLAAFRGVDIVAVEQPFHEGDLASHALLARELVTAISLDESVRSLGDLRLVERHHAASLVCIKPARLGGLAVARAALREANAFHLRAYVGGFFESPLSRAANAAVAAGAEVEASDVGPVQTCADVEDAPADNGIGWIPDLRGARALASQSWR